LTYLGRLENGSVGSFFTGIPEMEELKLNEVKYKAWVRKTCRLIFRKVSVNGIYLMFFKILNLLFLLY
jgi:hypothetical protein